jgi:hypothetical protein
MFLFSGSYERDKEGDIVINKENLERKGDITSHNDVSAFYFEYDGRTYGVGDMFKDSLNSPTTWYLRDINFDKCMANLINVTDSGKTGMVVTWKYLASLIKVESILKGD